jgi:pimeloyl-ACP methyl ester carboxylesterase
VYLVHGWGGRSEQLANFVRPLVAGGFRVVAFDAPAHGRSAGRLSSGPQFGRALAAVASRCGRPHAVVAHSLGAAATVFACREGLRPDRLVFVGPAADPVAWARQFARTLGLSTRVQALLRSRSERRIRASWDDLKIVPPSGMAPPLLVVHDREDQEVPWHDGAGIAAVWPGARLVTTTGLGHRRILKDSRTVDLVTAFVAGDADPDAGRCGHGRIATGACEACALEAELFAPAARRELTARGSAARIASCRLAPGPQ